MRSANHCARFNMYCLNWILILTFKVIASLPGLPNSLQYWLYRSDSRTLTNCILVPTRSILKNEYSFGIYSSSTFHVSGFQVLYMLLKSKFWSARSDSNQPGLISEQRVFLQDLGLLSYILNIIIKVLSWSPQNYLFELSFWLWNLHACKNQD